VNDNLKEALRLINIGYKVYPVWGINKNGTCMCGGKPGCRPGKHPWGRMVLHGEKQASRDEATVRTWFPGPGVNVGISVDGFYVLDVELKGMGLLAAWEAEHGPMPSTPTAESGSGARHFYFQVHPDVAASRPTMQVKFVEGGGAELLTAGAVIAPPSSHKDGGRYRWLTGPETPLAPMPDWLVEKIMAYMTSKTPKAATPVPDVGDVTFDPMKVVISAGRTFDDLGMLPAGQRHEPVNAVIASMFGNGYTEDEILADGLRWAAGQEPPYSPKDVEEKVRWYARREAAKQAAGKVADVEFPELPDGPLDVDVVLKSHSSFVVRMPDAPPEYPPTPVEPSAGELPEDEQEDRTWLTYGFAGQFAEAVGPQVEGAVEPVVACMLMCFGSAVGGQPHVAVGGSRHAGNLFAVLVAPSGVGKSEPWKVCSTLMGYADADWLRDAVSYGLGSGEGLVERLQGEERRCLAREAEFGALLTRCRREGSTTSQTICQGFDGDTLCVDNRKPANLRAEDAHVSIWGNITTEELHKRITTSLEAVNGFGNRFLWLAQRQVRFLSRGGDLRCLERLAGSLREAIQRARRDVRELTWSAEGGAIWDAAYRPLCESQARHWSLGRARVHALRLTLLYALLDGSDVIMPEHVRAGLSAWTWCERSAGMLFAFGPDGRPPRRLDGGEPVDEPTEDPPHVRLLALARSRPDGITKTDGLNLFHRNRKTADVGADFDILTSAGFGSWQGNRWHAVGGSPDNRPYGVGGADTSMAGPEPERITHTHAVDVEPVCVHALCVPERAVEQANVEPVCVHALCVPGGEADGRAVEQANVEPSRGMRNALCVPGEPEPSNARPVNNPTPVEPSSGEPVKGAKNVESTDVECGSCHWLPEANLVVRTNPDCVKLACDKTSSQPPPGGPPSGDHDDVPPGYLEAALGPLPQERGVL
jgi:hypothetical protein